MLCREPWRLTLLPSSLQAIHKYAKTSAYAEKRAPKLAELSNEAHCKHNEKKRTKCTVTQI